MTILSVVFSIAYVLLLVYFFVMWARFILELARSFARHWRPRGFGLVAAELVFTVTDPPIRFVRRLVPPVRVGTAALDFGWSIVMLVVIVLIYVALQLARVL